MNVPFAPRDWQLAQDAKFTTKRSPTWTTVAGTGTGKTVATGLLIDRVIKKHPNLLVVVVAPLSEVKEGWALTLDVNPDDPGAPHFGWPTETNIHIFDDQNDRALVTTYSGVGDMLRLTVLKTNRPVLIVFDEIHRLEESVKEGATSSGWTHAAKELFEMPCVVQTICLTATPWREKPGVQLPFVEYSDKGIIVHSFAHTYGDELNLGAKVSGVTYGTFRSLHARCEKFNKDRERWEWVDTEKMAEYDPERRNIPFGLGPFVDFGSRKKYKSRPYAGNLLRKAIRTLTTMRSKSYHGAKGVVFCKDIDSATVIAQVLKELQQDVVVIHSKANNIRESMASLRAPTGATWAVSVGMLGEGVDVPNIKVIVDFSDELTLRSIIQRWGRALRKITDAPWLNAKIFHIDHAVLAFVAASLKKEIKAAKGREPKTKKSGADAQKGSTGYRNFSDTDSGARFDEVAYNVEVAVLADWLHDTREHIKDYTTALLLAEELIRMDALPEGFIPTHTEATKKKTSRQAKQEATDVTQQQVSHIATSPGYVHLPQDARFIAVNGDIKYDLVCQGYTPKTKAYRDRRAVLVAQRAKALGWVA